MKLKIIVIHQKTKPLYKVKLEDSILLFPAELGISVSLHHFVAVSLYYKRISISEANYASNQSPTTRVLAISYFFLYFVNVVLNSNEKVHTEALCLLFKG